MQLTTFLSAAAAVATVAARNAVDLTKSCDFGKPHIRIINRCEYKVNVLNPRTHCVGDMR